MGKKRNREEEDTADSKFSRRIRRSSAAEEDTAGVQPPNLPEDMIWSSWQDESLLREIARYRNREGPYSGVGGNWTRGYKAIRSYMLSYYVIGPKVMVRDLEARCWHLKQESTVPFAYPDYKPVMGYDRLCYNAFKEPLLPPPPRPRQNSRRRASSSGQPSGSRPSGSGQPSGSHGSESSATLELAEQHLAMLKNYEASLEPWEFDLLKGANIVDRPSNLIESRNLNHSDFVCHLKRQAQWVSDCIGHKRHKKIFREDVARLLKPDGFNL